MLIPFIPSLFLCYFLLSAGFPPWNIIDLVISQLSEPSTLWLLILLVL